MTMSNVPSCLNGWFNSIRKIPIGYSQQCTIDFIISATPQ
jgi:hypothetical protein